MRFPAYTTGYRIDRSLLNDTKSEALARKKASVLSSHRNQNERKKQTWMLDGLDAPRWYMYVLFANLHTDVSPRPWRY